MQPEGRIAVMPIEAQPKVPEISPQMRSVIEQLHAKLEQDAEPVVAAILGQVTEYRAVSDRAAVPQMRESVALNLRLWFQALLSGNPPDKDDVASVLSLATKRVHQGISLAGLLHAYRVGASGIWAITLESVRDDPELHREMLFNLSPYLLAHFDQIAQEIALAYANEMRHSARWRDRLRAEIWNVIQHRPDDAEAFEKHLEALGLDSSPPYCAVALRLRRFPEISSRLESVLDPVIDGVCRVFQLKRARLFRVLHTDCLVAWLPVPGAASTLEFDHQLAEQAERVIPATANVAAVGIGLPGTGPRGWGQSVEQALKALKSDGRWGSSNIHRYSDIVLDDAVAASHNAARYFDAMVERLAQEPNLLETARAYFAHRQHRKATAGALEIHPNTLDYRLQRIETLTGLALGEAASVAKLHTALSRSPR